MSYIKHTLLENEKIIYMTGPHWIVFSRAISTFFVFLLFFIMGDSILPNSYFFGFDFVKIINIGLFLFSIFQAIAGYVRFTTSEYGITDQRIIMKVGFIRRDTLELMLKRIESIQVDQGILGRIFDYGSVSIRGTGGSHDPFYNVPRPMEFRKLVQAQIALSQK